VTVAGALRTIRRVGAVEISSGKLRLTFPESERAALQPAIDALRAGRDEALRLLSEPPQPEHWPDSLLGMADEVSVAVGDADAGRRRVWMSWCEWKAGALNKLFLERGATGQLGRITPETIRHGERPRRSVRKFHE
jgi:hypothetical protein